MCAVDVTLLQIKENSSIIFFKINCTYPYVVWVKCNTRRLVFVHGGHGEVEVGLHLFLTSTLNGR